MSTATICHIIYLRCRLMQTVADNRMWLPDLPAGRLPHLLDAMNDEVHGFNSSAPLATVSLDTKSFSTDMWRGPMWLNTNWHVALALIDRGENQTAAKVLRRTLDVVLDDYEKYGVIFGESSNGRPQPSHEVV